MITAEELRMLAAESGFPRLSLYMPVAPVGPAMRQNPIRLKNLLKAAGAALAARGVADREAAALLADLHGRVDDLPFWQRGEGGLAVFASPAGTRYEDVPLDVPEQVRVGERFDVKPLLPLFMRDGLFCVLAVSAAAVDLYRATRHGMTRIADERLPRSAETFLGTEAFANVIAYHANAAGSASAQFHAGGDTVSEEVEGRLKLFADAVGQAVDAMLAGSGTPLVLAADDRMLGRLRGAIRHAGLIEAGIREHPAALDAATLHARAYALARPQLDEARRSAIARFLARMGDGEDRASSRIEEILPAAAQGRVEALILDAAADLPGRFDEAAQKAVRQDPPDAAAIDLLDRAVVEVLAHGGAVFARPQDRDRDLPMVAALYRF